MFETHINQIHVKMFSTYSFTVTSRFVWEDRERGWSGTGGPENSGRYLTTRKQFMRIHIMLKKQYACCGVINIHGCQFFTDKVNITVSRIHKLMANDVINTKCNNKLHFNEHLTLWINLTTESTKIGIQWIHVLVKLQVPYYKINVTVTIIHSVHFLIITNKWSFWCVFAINRLKILCQDVGKAPNDYLSI